MIGFPGKKTLCLAIGSAGTGIGGHAKYKDTRRKDADDDWGLLSTKMDIENFKDFVQKTPQWEWYGSYEVSGRCGSKKEAITNINKFFLACQETKSIPMIYYTGHGDEDGDWHFPDGEITFDDVENFHDTHPSGYVVNVICDCCFSGNWAKESEEMTKMNIYAACGPGETAINRIFAEAMFNRSAEHMDVLRDLNACYTKFNGRQCVFREY